MSEGNGNGKNVASNTKKLGGITGKGFMPGKSGNPQGGRIPIKQAHAFGEWLRKWLLKEKTFTIGEKEVKCRRVEWLVNKIADQKPDVLLHYAYGKPAEMVEIASAEGAPFEFVVKVSQGNNGDK